MSDSTEIEQAYRELDEAIRKVTSLDIIPNIFVDQATKATATDWVVGVALQTYDEDGNVVDVVEPILPDGGKFTPRYRTFGLLKDLTVQYDAVASAQIYSALMNRRNEED